MQSSPGQEQSKSLQVPILVLSMVLVMLCALGYRLHLHNTQARSTPTAATAKLVVKPKDTLAATLACTGGMLFMGDTMLARDVGAAIVAGDNPYEYVSQSLAAASLRIANIETTIANVGAAAGTKKYTFNAPTAALKTLKQNNIDVSVLANNHTSDYGAVATTNMLQLFKDTGLKTVGAGTTVERAFAPLVVEMPLKCDGDTVARTARVGFVAANDVENNYTAVNNSRAGSAYFDEATLRASIAAAKEQGAELVVALTHWGTEYSLAQNTRQQNLGRMLVDAGADAVIGGHPHVIQPTETYKDKPIVYSLGNFIFDGMGGMPNATNGNMVVLPVAKTFSVQGEKTISEQPLAAQPLTYAPYTLNSSGFPVPD